MKKLLIASLTVAFFASAAFSFDTDSFSPQGAVASYTKTEYTIVSKFGSTYRSPAVKYVHTFDSTGLEKECTGYNARDVITDRATFTYDISRRLTLVALYDSQNNAIGKKTMEYTTDGRLKTESEYDGKENLTGRTIYDYAPAKVTESQYNGDGKLLRRIISTTNAQEKPLEVYTYYGNGALSQKELITYLENGALSQKEVYTSSGDLERKVVYRYDSDNMLSEIQTYDAENTLYERQIYKSDSHGNPTSVSTYSVAEKFGAITAELQEQTGIVYSYR